MVTWARALIVAPDVRPSSTAHIKPVKMLQAVLAAAEAAGVPVVFALSRRGIGQVRAHRAASPCSKETLHKTSFALCLS